MGLSVSKVWVSASYVLVRVGASGLVFQVFEFLSGTLRFSPAVLSAWGRNPLVLYLLHIALLGVFVLPGVPAWYAQAPAWLTVLEALALLGVLSRLGLIFQRKGWLFFALSMVGMHRENTCREPVVGIDSMHWMGVAMKVFVPREIREGERRVALVPESAKKLVTKRGRGRH